MAHKGFDKNKRWGNSAQEGHGVNSPAMMESRAKSKALKKRTETTGSRKKDFTSEGKQGNWHKVHKLDRN